MWEWLAEVIEESCQVIIMVILAAGIMLELAFLFHELEP